ncbi:MAG: ABC transporter substrate-binding protein, partial [Roseiflexaceae bacterium]
LNDTVQVISGYANNEPLQLYRAGTAVSVLRVADVAPIASDHLIVNTAYNTANASTVAQFVTALQKGMQSVADDPAAAYDASLSFIPEADPANRDVTIEILRATVAMWRADARVFGQINPPKWEQTHALLRAIGLLAQDVDVTTAYDVTYVNE